MATQNLNPRLQLRKKLMRRLIWKAPLILGLVSFAVWWQVRQDAEKVPADRPTAASVEIAQRVTGVWHGEVSYPGRGKFIDQFLYQPEGDKLFGTASYLARKYGIEEGRITGENIAFFIHYSEASGDSGLDHKNYYWGTLSGDQIKMRLQNDQGSQPIDFTLVKSAEKGNESTAAKAQ
jgi:hypothetical protein